MADRQILVFSGAQPIQQPANDTLVLTGPLDIVTHYVTATAELTLMPGGNAGIRASNQRNARGDFSVDLQMSADADTQVASGSSAMILGGARNTSSGIRSMVVGGEDNTTAGQASCIVSGDQGSIDSGSVFSVIAGGQRNSMVNSDYAFIGCGDTCTANASNNASIGGGVSNDVTGAIAGTISGGSNNDVTGVAGTVGGGQTNLAAGSRSGVFTGRGNSSSGDYAGVCSGNACVISSAGDWGFIGGGKTNTVTDLYSAVVGGIDNTVDGSRGAIGGGNSNTIDSVSDFGTIAGGSVNDVAADYGCIPGGTLNSVTGVGGMAVGGGCSAVGDYSVAMGKNASAPFYGSVSQSAGDAVDPGDTQSLTVVMVGVTTNTTTKLLHTDGSSEKLTMDTSSSWMFHIWIHGFNYDDASQSAAYEITGVCRRDGAANIAFVGTPTKLVIVEDDALWNAWLTANTTTQSLDINVFGPASANVSWMAKMEILAIVTPN